jgi:hypothetical protein
MLAGFHCDADHIHMGGGIGEDRNCFHFGVCAHGCGLRINLFNVQLVSDLLCAGSVAIADSDELHAGNAVRDIACMLITKTSDTDNTHLKLFHDFSPLHFLKLFLNPFFRDPEKPFPSVTFFRIPLQHPALLSLFSL